MLGVGFWFWYTLLLLLLCGYCVAVFAPRKMYACLYNISVFKLRSSQLALGLAGDKIRAARVLLLRCIEMSRAEQRSAVLSKFTVFRSDLVK